MINKWTNNSSFKNNRNISQIERNSASIFLQGYIFQNIEKSKIRNLIDNNHSQKVYKSSLIIGLIIILNPIFIDFMDQEFIDFKELAFFQEKEYINQEVVVNREIVEEEFDTLFWLLCTIQIILYYTWFFKSDSSNNWDSLNWLRGLSENLNLWNYYSEPIEDDDRFRLNDRFGQIYPIEFDREIPLIDTIDWSEEFGWNWMNLQREFEITWNYLKSCGNQFLDGCIEFVDIFIAVF